MIARFGQLYPFQDNELIVRSDEIIRETYNKLFVNLENGRRESINTLFVILAVMVGKLVQRIFPNAVYNKRLTIEIMHCILFCTLGIMVGDNCVKYLIGRELGHRQMTRFLFRKMFEEKIMIAKIKEIEDEKEWPELKKLFYEPPPPPPQKIPFDEGKPATKPD